MAVFDSSLVHKDIMKRKHKTWDVNIYCQSSEIERGKVKTRALKRMERVAQDIRESWYGKCEVRINADDKRLRITLIESKTELAVTKTLQRQTKIDEHFVWKLDTPDKRRKLREPINVANSGSLLATAFKHGRFMKHFEALGYVVLEEVIPPFLCALASEFCIGYSKQICARAGRKVKDNNFDCMLDVEWRDVVSCCSRKKAFDASLGGGEIFRQKEVTEAIELLTVQYYIKDLVTAMADECLGIQLGDRKKEGFSLKYEMWPALEAHIDSNRKIQAVISLTKNVQGFLVWPKSHKAGLSCSHPGGFHTLAGNQRWHAQLRHVGSNEAIYPSKAGDVLIFVGGKFLHGSPSGPTRESQEQLRLATYASFD